MIVKMNGYEITKHREHYIVTSTEYPALDELLDPEEIDYLITMAEERSNKQEFTTWHLAFTFEDDELVIRLNMDDRDINYMGWDRDTAQGGAHEDMLDELPAKLRELKAA